MSIHCDLLGKVDLCNSSPVYCLQHYGRSILQKVTTLSQHIARLLGSNSQNGLKVLLDNGVATGTGVSHFLRLLGQFQATLHSGE